MQPTIWTHRCCQAGCDEAATQVVVEADRMAMLFRDGAGVMCDKHAQQIAAVGGVPLPFPTYVAAVVEYEQR